ncbi:benzoate/H(+) symporter BenE family transporter [Demequina zhanjiangensis]|uniref:Benzoate/H(+) symporter BenE family transporter n=1 Tax=Demequina zhanjiangensis TaxID=3051659 RepID=A0ABT8G427_9MICO|nr:benzoate/H(+) symporter BenE family transporter [Demequina sp. SYSU T00b26]MDN4473901.1 benzoate/H(+) symporter BenE family transporter [Demequina sp. SYSU T00b26]
MEHARRHTIAMGLVTALVGFTSSFAVVLAGLRAVGATPAQAASGLAALCVTQALGMLWLSWRYRTPLTLAWSTPGAALLASQGAVDGGWPAAVGAFLLVGILILATGLLTPLGRLIGLIPPSIAQAMLAGVLLPLCLAPFTSLADRPWLVGALIVVWLVTQRVASRWATPLTFGVAVVMMVVAATRDGGVPVAAPTLELTAPTFTWGAMLGLAIPLYIVTMASQNVPGVAVLRAAGYETPWKPSMIVTGIGSLAGAGFGGHAINLAAITAALPASPESHPDPKRRWVATATAGWAYLAIAVVAASLTALVDAAPAGLLEAVAGLALLATFASSVSGSMADADDRVPAAITLLLAASGVAILGIGSAFWALLLGLGVRWLLRRRAPLTPEASTPAREPQL